MIIYVILAVIIVILVFALLHFIIDNKYMKSKINLLEKKEDSRIETYEVVDTMRRCCNKIDNLLRLIRAVKIDNVLEEDTGYVKCRGGESYKFIVGSIDVCKHNNQSAKISVDGLIIKEREENKYE